MHLIGKEISRFHCVYWPAFLMAAGIEPPRSVRANGWLLFDQGKMSKSRGNIVRAETIDEVLGADALRYFLLREIPFGQDGNFSFDALVQRYNGDLANGYGNLVSRVVNMVHKYFGGVVPEAGAETQAEAALRASAERAIAAFGPAFDELNFSEALKSLWALVAETDGYLTANAPWKKPADRCDADHATLQARVLATAAEAIRVITALVYPILPDAAAKVWRQLGLGEIADAAKQAFLTDLAWGGLKPGTKFGEPAPLFPRAEKDAIERMQNLEDENNRSAVEAASGSSGEANDRATNGRRTGCATSPWHSNASAPRGRLTKPRRRRIPGVHSHLKVGEKQRGSGCKRAAVPRQMRPKHRPRRGRSSTLPSTTLPKWTCAWRRFWWPSACPRPTSCCAWKSTWAMRSGRFWPALRSTTSRRS